MLEISTHKLSVSLHRRFCRILVTTWIMQPMMARHYCKQEVTWVSSSLQFSWSFSQSVQTRKAGNESSSSWPSLSKVAYSTLIRMNPSWWTSNLCYSSETLSMLLLRSGLRLPISWCSSSDPSRTRKTYYRLGPTWMFKRVNSTSDQKRVKSSWPRWRWTPSTWLSKSHFGVLWPASASAMISHKSQSQLSIS